MARAGIATAFGEHGHDILAEAEGDGRGREFHRDVDRGRAVSGGGGDGGLAVGDGVNPAGGIDAGDLVVAAAVGGGGGVVEVVAALGAGLDDEGVRALRVDEGDGRGCGAEVGDGVGGGCSEGAQIAERDEEEGEEMFHVRQHVSELSHVNT